MDLVDLENGGGGGGGDKEDGVPLLRCPDPADRRSWEQEQQPFTRLRAAPYIATTLVGAALYTVCTVLVYRWKDSAGHLKPNITATEFYGDAALALIAGLVTVFALAQIIRRADCWLRPRLDADLDN